MLRQLTLVLLFISMMIGTAQAASVTLDSPDPPPVFTSASIFSDGAHLTFLLQFANGFNYNDHDQLGRQAESFQWYLTTKLGATRPSNIHDVEYIIRGDGFGENHTVELCTAFPLGVGCAGGWGIDLGAFATDLDQTGLLTFEVPTAFFGTDALQYDVLGFRYGELNDGLNGFASGGDANRWFPFPRDIEPPNPPGDPLATPEPSSLTLMLLLICGFCARKWLTVAHCRRGL